MKRRFDNKKRDLPLGVDLGEGPPFSGSSAFFSDGARNATEAESDSEVPATIQSPTASDYIEAELRRQHTEVAQYGNNLEAKECCWQFINSYLALNGTDQLILSYLDSVSSMVVELLQDSLPA